jgi:hypothetical protein
MIFKLGDLQTTVSSLQGILTQKLPIKSAYWLGKFLARAQRELQDFQTARLRLLEEYSLKAEDGTPVRFRIDEAGARIVCGKDYRGDYQYDVENIPEADKDAFGKGYQDLASTEVAFEFRPLTLEQLGDKAEISPVDMVALLPFIADEGEKPAAPVQ